MERAHRRQLERQGKPNAALSSGEIDCYCVPDADGEQLLRQAIRQLDFSARAYHRILKVARTIADLADREQIVSRDVAEGIQYRRLARG